MSSAYSWYPAKEAPGQRQHLVTVKSNDPGQVEPFGTSIEASNNGQQAEICAEGESEAESTTKGRTGRELRGRQFEQ